MLRITTLSLITFFALAANVNSAHANSINEQFLRNQHNVVVNRLGSSIPKKVTFTTKLLNRCNPPASISDSDLADLVGYCRRDGTFVYSVQYMQRQGFTSPGEARAYTALGLGEAAYVKRVGGFRFVDNLFIRLAEQDQMNGTDTVLEAARLQFELQGCIAGAYSAMFGDSPAANAALDSVISVVFFNAESVKAAFLQGISLRSINKCFNQPRFNILLRK